MEGPNVLVLVIGQFGLWQVGPPALRVAQKPLCLPEVALHPAAFRDLDLFWIPLIRLL
jgi:hypothetical protein